MAIPAKLAPTDKKQSYGGRGPAIDFVIDAAHLGDAADGGSLAKARVKGFRIYAGRYGGGYDPASTMIKTAMLNSDAEIKWKGRFAYSLFTYNAKWVNLALPKPVALSELVGEDHKLRVALNPEAHQTKGIYFFYRPADGQSNSLAGTVEDGFAPVQDREWLIQVCLDLKGGDETSAGKPAAR